MLYNSYILSYSLINGGYPYFSMLLYSLFRLKGESQDKSLEVILVQKRADAYEFTSRLLSVCGSVSEG